MIMLTWLPVLTEILFSMYHVGLDKASSRQILKFFREINLQAQRDRVRLRDKYLLSHIPVIQYYSTFTDLLRNWIL